MTSRLLDSWPCELIQHDYLGDEPLPISSLGKADLIFADPPYNYGVKYEDDPTRDKMTPEQYREFTERTIRDAVRVARPGATFWWMTPEEHADWTGAMLTDLVGPRLYRIVWEESFAQYQGDRALTKDYRFIFCHVVRPEVSEAKDWGKDLLTWNPQDIRVPSARQLIYKDKRSNPKGRVPGTTWKFEDGLSIDDIVSQAIIALPHSITHDAVTFTPRSDGSGSAHTDLHNVIASAIRHALKQPQMPGQLWKFRRLQGTSHDHVDWHPCQLPPELLERIVKGWSNQADVVLDLFAGSGSLARVCRRLGRTFVGADRSETYIQRMADELL